MNPVAMTIIIHLKEYWPSWRSNQRPPVQKDYENNDQIHLSEGAFVPSSLIKDVSFLICFETIIKIKPNYFQVYRTERKRDSQT